MKIPTLAITVFIGLALVFAVLSFLASLLSDPFAQQLLLSLGSAIFGAGLVFFLLKITTQEG